MSIITDSGKDSQYINDVKFIDKKKQLQTVQEKQLADIKNKMLSSSIRDDKFFTPVYFTTSDFVIGEELDDAFTQCAEDLSVINNAIDTLTLSVNSSKDIVKNNHTKLQLNINRLSSFIDTVAMYNGTAFSNVVPITESFGSDNDLVNNSISLLADTFEQKLTLSPTLIEVDNLSNTTIVVNDTSNGAFTNESPADNIIDGSDVTYAEYYQTASAGKLQLNFNIILETPKIINYLSIVPNNFNTQNWIHVEDILTSVDGSSFTSIYDSNTFYRKFLFKEEDNATIVELNPNKNKSINKFIFDFQPIRAKYIQIILSQEQLHPETDNLRIGINDISIGRIKYKTSGSVVIKKLCNPADVKTLAIHTDQRSLVDSRILIVTYQISFDQNTWYDIQPVSSSGTKPEVLYFNSSWQSGSVDLSAVDSDYIYIKVSMSKNTSVSDINDLLSSYSVSTNEYFTFPVLSPYKLTLNKTAVKSSINLFALPYMAAGKTGLNDKVLGTVEANVFYYEFAVPFNLNDMAEIFIGQRSIQKYSTIENLLLTEDVGYYYENNIIHIAFYTGHIERNNVNDPILMSINNDTAIISKNNSYAGQLVTLRINAEIVSSKSRCITLSYATDGIKENISVRRLKFDTDGKILQTVNIDLLPAGMNQLRLSAKPISTEIVEILGRHQIKFTNGVNEFIDADDDSFSIDYDNRVLYLKTVSTAKLGVSYLKEEAFELNLDDFDIASDFQTATIREWAFDPDSYYEFKYNISVTVPNSCYTVSADNNSIQITDIEIMKSLLGISTFTDSNLKIKISYLYKENLKEVLGEIADYISPVLNKLTILYSI